MATATATKRKQKKSTKVAFRPLDDRVLIRQSDPKETTTGGIILPDSAKEKPQAGTIIAVGPGKLLDSGARGELSVKTGDEVFYGKYSGTEVDLDGEEFVIVRESDILAIIQ
ncbi:MAG: co-chaperone GroES [Phycisphaerae bacterium]